MEERNELFDEVLDVLPLHWSGEPFSYKGRHFEARDVIARPRPVQLPIPIWIGGNSKLARRRVAERAQGWMPMFGSPELSATTRTPMISSLAELSGQVQELREAAAAAGRPETIEVLYSYHDRGIEDPAAEPDRHREAFAEIEKAGVTWLVVTSRTHAPAATFEFLEAFGTTYLS
jgi:alkanesulfonate monooxygenase SsuD/methylene tetrahydromethanopterin reductase-like flavin-dependent oxidoreductase (luciferase family)